EKVSLLILRRHTGPRAASGRDQAIVVVGVRIFQRKVSGVLTSFPAETEMLQTVQDEGRHGSYNAKALMDSLAQGDARAILLLPPVFLAVPAGRLRREVRLRLGLAAQQPVRPGQGPRPLPRIHQHPGLRRGTGL